MNHPESKTIILGAWPRFLHRDNGDAVEIVAHRTEGGACYVIARLRYASSAKKLNPYGPAMWLPASELHLVEKAISTTRELDEEAADFAKARHFARRSVAQASGTR